MKEIITYVGLDVHKDSIFLDEKKEKIYQCRQSTLQGEGDETS